MEESEGRAGGRHWFAARIHAGSLVARRILNDGVRTYRTPYAPGIFFIFCDEIYTMTLRSDFWGSIFFYTETDRKTPAPVDDNEMRNFILVTSSGEKLINLGEVSREFLTGDRVRVVSGPLTGAEGVVKRIKGDRRLIVSIDRLTAVATCYIKPDCLEKID